MKFLFHKKDPQAVREIKSLRPKSKWRFLIWGIVAIVIVVLGWLGTTSYLAYRHISSTNESDDPAFFKYGDNIDPSKIGTEGNSRINVLLLGHGGSNHPGGNLTDSIQILSIDPINKTMSYLSIPRDLYVQQANGAKLKINTVYSNGSAYCKVKTCPSGVDQGGVAMKAMVSDIIGQPIHYFIKIDFTGFEKIIDTLGGINIYVDKAIYDPYYPDSSMTGYATFSVKAGQQKMTGATALKYARSRETTSDFDRARRQQQVISAVREKALSLEVLTNPSKITNIINTLGSHMKTDISLSNLTKFASLIKEVDGKEAKSLVLDTATTSPLKSLSDPTAGYIIIPRLGMNTYTDVQETALTILTDPYITKEGAKVVIINASGKAANSQLASDKLKKLGYNVVSTTASATTQSNTSISGGDKKPYTLALLKKRFSLTSAGKIASSDTSGADIIVTLGNNFILK